MTAETMEASVSRSRGSDRGGVLADRTFRIVAVASGFSVLVVLALILISTTQAAWPAFAGQGLSFLTSQVWNVPENQFGALAFAFGTILTSVIALVLAVPVSIGIALFVTEVAPFKVRKPIVYTVDLLASIPSVVYGLWGVRVFAPWVDKIYENVAGFFDGWPVLGTIFSGRPVSGVSFMTAGIIVAIMITPIISSLSREVLATVPRSIKEGSFALGSTRWEMIRGVAIPHSRGGITASVMIGLGRAMGETIAVALVIGSSNQITARLFSPGDAMASVIANQFGESTGEYRAALIGLGVVLFAITLVVNLGAKAYISRSERKLGGVT
jgi:phosphate transport system permease protein